MLSIFRSLAPIESDENESVRGANEREKSHKRQKSAGKRKSARVECKKSKEIAHFVNGSRWAISDSFFEFTTDFHTLSESAFL